MALHHSPIRLGALRTEALFTLLRNCVEELKTRGEQPALKTVLSGEIEDLLIETAGATKGGLDGFDTDEGHRGPTDATQVRLVSSRQEDPVGEAGPAQAGDGGTAERPACLGQPRRRPGSGECSESPTSPTGGTHK